MYRSCALTHENNYYIFGGNSNRRQTLKLINCGLTLVGALEFNFSYGACSSTNGIIVLCFDQYDSKQCRQATSPFGPWSIITPSTFDHRYTSSLASSPGNKIYQIYKKYSQLVDAFLAVGSYNPSNVKAELYDYGTGDWTSVPDYPFGSGSSVYAFDMLFIGELSTYFVIGGYDINFSMATIAKFKNGAWSHAGRLNSARQVLSFIVFILLSNFKSHRAEWLDGAMIVAGGNSGTLSTESCTLDENGVFNCVDISPSLTGYIYGSSFSVPANYCV